MTTKENARGQAGEISTANKSIVQNSTKLDRVIAALHHPHGLNRFEAERIGCHVLNSTVAVIRKRYGSRLISQWETIPSRFCERGVRVLRYWIVEGSHV